MPFMSYSLRSAIGSEIEGHLNRLGLNVPIDAEFDTASSQLSAVGDGMGWSLSPLLCLLLEVRQLDRLKIGRASSWERVCQYVLLWVDAVSLKSKTTRIVAASVT